MGLTMSNGTEFGSKKGNKIVLFEVFFSSGKLLFGGLGVSSVHQTGACDLLCCDHGCCQRPPRGELEMNKSGLRAH